MAIEKDILLNAACRMAPDVHVPAAAIVVEDWNASDIYAIVGYSAQLHALTNVPVRIKR